MGFFDLGTIFFMVLAVVIFLQLRNVLGRRTGNERPPFDPYKSAERSGGAAQDNVVSLPTRRTENQEEPVVDEKAIDRIAEPGTSGNDGLKAIAKADPSFDPKTFMEGARAAYEWIVVAFAEGDRDTLRKLLSKDVYNDFETAITEREKSRQKADTTFVGIEKMKVADAGLQGSEAFVTLRIVAQLITVIYDEAGEILEGDPDHVSEGTDVWTFARDVQSNDPNWKLVATGEG